jgi:hypothetical protein
MRDADAALSSSSPSICVPSNSITIGVIAAFDSVEAIGSPGPADGAGVRVAADESGAEGAGVAEGDVVAKEDVPVTPFPSLPALHADSAAASSNVAGKAPNGRTRPAGKGFLAVFLAQR